MHGRCQSQYDHPDADADQEAQRPSEESISNREIATSASHSVPEELPLDLAASPFNLFLPLDLDFITGDNILDDFMGYAVPDWNYSLGLGPRMDEHDVLVNNTNGTGYN